MTELGEWLLPSIGTGFLVLFGAMLRHFTQSMLSRMDRQEESLNKLHHLVAVTEARLTLGNQAFQDLRERVQRLEDRR